jgi:hypothetical protein
MQLTHGRPFCEYMGIIILYKIKNTGLIHTNIRDYDMI